MPRVPSGSTGVLPDLKTPGPSGVFPTLDGPGDSEGPVRRGCGYSIIGAMIRANLFRARFNRLFTVPRLQPVISAISS